MRIIDGELPDGTALPSVRSLAAQLGVSPVTVVQAYKALQASGLIQSVPKRGFFVTTHPASPRRSGDTARIAELLDQALDAALDAGLDEAEFTRLATERARARKNQPRIVAVIGYQEASLQERIEAVRSFLRNRHVIVIGLSFETLEAMTGDDRAARVKAVNIFLVSVGEVDKAAALLEARSTRILPMTRVLRDDVIQFIRDQPDSTHFGIIAESPEYAQRMLAELRRTRDMQTAPLVSVVSDGGQVQRVVSKADAILIGSLAASKIDGQIRSAKPAIVFVFVPDARTLSTLRRLLHQGIY